MTNLESREPDMTLVLDCAGIIQQAIAGDLVADEPVADWIGQPWVETVRQQERADIGRLFERARSGGIAGIGQVAQRFPSGLVLPLEYTTVRLAEGAGIIAVGKQLRAVAQLQSRLLDAQRVLEQDCWKLRAVETRYRMLVDSAQEAVITVEPDGLRISEINPPAVRLLGLSPGDTRGARKVELSSLLAEADRKALRDIVKRAQSNGLANGMLPQLKGKFGPWLLRASLIPATPGNSLLQLQIAAAASAIASSQAAKTRTSNDEAQADFVERWPDGFVLIDADGVVLRTNAAFVEMTQEGCRSALLGQSVGRWLGRPGADLSVLLINVQRFGRLRLFPTLIRGSLGSEIEVELSAVGECDVGPQRIAVLVRDASRRAADATLRNRCPCGTCWQGASAHRRRRDGRRG
ncbi:MAG: transcriptional regulator PpsR [Thiohalocapsa sp.]